MRIFGDHVRTELDPKRENEGKFAYLDRSARAPAGCVRAALQEWFDHYPAKHRLELLNSLRSRDEATHCGAVLELVVHEVLHRFGCLPIIHPDRPGTGKHPDFGVTCQWHGETFVEATAVRRA